MVSKKTLVGILKNDPQVMRHHYRRFSSNVAAFNQARKNRGAEDYHDLDLDGINFDNADLQEINFENVNLGHATLDGANFEGANLRRARFDYTSAIGTNFRSADLKNCNGLYKIDGPDDAHFEQADLRGAHLRVWNNDDRYDHNIKRLLEVAHFSGTKITPEQREQLITLFGIPEDDLERRFVVLPRGRYPCGPNDYFYEKSVEAYEQVRKEGRIFTEKLNGNTLEYALVPVQGNEDIYNHTGSAFSFCKMSALLTDLLGSAEARYKGEWLYFVFNSVPERFREFAAVHEFGERAGRSHKEATIMEYERARSKGKLEDYLTWIVAEHQDKLIGDAIHIFAKEGMERLPIEVLEATKKVMPKNIRLWKRKQETRKRGLPFDLWQLAWEGLTEDEIVERLAVKGYDLSPDTASYWKEQMEIPASRAIQKLTYLKPG